MPNIKEAQPPIRVSPENHQYKCPRCGDEKLVQPRRNNIPKWMSFCEICGQKINWMEAE